MIFKSKYVDRRFFASHSRDFFDSGYYACLHSDEENDKQHLDFLELLVAWGDGCRKDNTIFRRSVDELNEDWIQKIEEQIKKIKIR